MIGRKQLEDHLHSLESRLDALEANVDYRVNYLRSHLDSRLLILERLLFDELTATYELDSESFRLLKALLFEDDSGDFGGGAPTPPTVSEVVNKLKAAKARSRGDAIQTIDSLNGRIEELRRDVREVLQVISADESFSNDVFHRIIPVRVYSFSDKDAMRLINSTADILRSSGFSMFDEDPPELGSWFGRFFFAHRRRYRGLRSSSDWQKLSVLWSLQKSMTSNHMLTRI
jgi:hypothetical protein